MSPKRSLTLFVPGLLQPPGRPDPAALPPAPELTRALSRARRSSGPAARFSGDKDQALFALFGLPTSSPLPVAALRYLGDTGQTPPPCILAADPVHLRPDRDQLVLFDARHFPLDQPEADTLAATLQALFDDFELTLQSTTPSRWYLIGDRCPDIDTSPPDQVCGRDLLRFMPKGADARRWTTVLNESQMLLHEHPVNQAREQQGLPAINSLWFWGGGQLDLGESAGPARFDTVFSDDPVTRGLATHIAVSAVQAPSGFSDWLGDNDAGAAMLQLDTAHRAAMAGDFAGWSEAVIDVEENWLPPLLEALASGGLNAVDLVCADGRRHRIDRRSLRRFWRRTRPLNRLLSKLEPTP